MTPLPRSTWSSRKPRSSKVFAAAGIVPAMPNPRIARPRFPAGLFVCRTQDASALCRAPVPDHAGTEGKVAGRKGRPVSRIWYEEANSPVTDRQPHGPRRCGGPEHSVGKLFDAFRAYMPPFQPDLALAGSAHFVSGINQYLVNAPDMAKYRNKLSGKSTIS